MLRLSELQCTHQTDRPNESFSNAITEVNFGFLALFSEGVFPPQIEATILYIRADSFAVLRHRMKYSFQ